MTAYTADMNHMHILPSGNWFTGFMANTETRTVSFNYCDRRRNGQVARRYIVRFEKDNSTVHDIVAISANGGRVEMFKSTVARETAANILRRALMVEFEQKLEEECEPQVEAKETEAVELCDKIINNMNSIAVVFAVIGFIVTLVYFFGEASTVESFMKALIGAEVGTLVALFAGRVAMDVKNRK